MKRIMLALAMLGASISSGWACVDVPDAEILPLRDGTLLIRTYSREREPRGAQFARVGPAGEYYGEVRFDDFEHRAVAAESSSEVWFFEYSSTTSESFFRLRQGGDAALLKERSVGRWDDDDGGGWHVVDQSPEGDWALIVSMDSWQGPYRFDRGTTAGARLRRLFEVSADDDEEHETELDWAVAGAGGQSLFIHSRGALVVDREGAVVARVPLATAAHVVSVEGLPGGGFVVMSYLDSDSSDENAPITRLIERLGPNGQVTLIRRDHPSRDAIGAIAGAAVDSEGEYYLWSLGDGFVQSLDLGTGDLAAFSVFAPKSAECWEDAQRRAAHLLAARGSDDPSELVRAVVELEFNQSDLAVRRLIDIGAEALEAILPELTGGDPDWQLANAAHEIAIADDEQSRRWVEGFEENGGVLEPDVRSFIVPTPSEIAEQRRLVAEWEAERAAMAMNSEEEADEP